MRDTDSAPAPVIGVTLGDPGGIGPEVVVRSIRELRAMPAQARPRLRLYGSRSVLEPVCERLQFDPNWWVAPRNPGLIAAADVHDCLVIDYDPWLVERGVARAGEAVRYPHHPSAIGGAVSFRWVDDAIADALRPAGDPMRLDAVVTGPISKQAWSLGGHGNFPDHTTLLGQRCRSRRFGMMFASPKLRVMLATIHVPLMDVRNLLTIGRVHEAIDLAHEGCVALGVAPPRIAVCGLNPHAGEGGLLGDEEERLIAPAIELARSQGMDVSGPWPADTVFNAAVDGRHDIVVAMYHDQGLIPVKLLGWDRAVNLTVGLPIVRTSPDHGTAFDLAAAAAGPPRAGATTVNPGSMLAAIELAQRLCAGRRVAAAG